MSQFYFDESRESDPHTLPDGEIFKVGEGAPEPGWYWWSCFPGCLPNSDPVGPFATESEALEDARS